MTAQDKNSDFSALATELARLSREDVKKIAEDAIRIKIDLGDRVREALKTGTDPMALVRFGADPQVYGLIASDAAKRDDFERIKELFHFAREHEAPYAASAIRAALVTATEHDRVELFKRIDTFIDSIEGLEGEVFKDSSFARPVNLNTLTESAIAHGAMAMVGHLSQTYWKKAEPDQFSRALDWMLQDQLFRIPDEKRALIIGTLIEAGLPNHDHLYERIALRCLAREPAADSATFLFLLAQPAFAENAAIVQAQSVQRFWSDRPRPMHAVLADAIATAKLDAEDKIGLVEQVAALGRLDKGMKQGLFRGALEMEDPRLARHMTQRHYTLSQFMQDLPRRLEWTVATLSSPEMIEVLGIRQHLATNPQDLDRMFQRNGKCAFGIPSAPERLPAMLMALRDAGIPAERLSRMGAALDMLAERGDAMSLYAALVQEGFGSIIEPHLDRMLRNAIRAPRASPEFVQLLFDRGASLGMWSKDEISNSKIFDIVERENAARSRTAGRRRNGA